MLIGRGELLDESLKPYLITMQVYLVLETFRSMQAGILKFCMNVRL